MMPAGRDEDAREWDADKRAAVADARDVAADARDVAADERDKIAGSRDELADAREQELLAWQLQLDARAARWGLVPDRAQDTAGRLEAADARRAAETDRSRAGDERDRAADARAEMARQRAADHRDTLLAATFAGVAEHFYEADDPDEVLTRIAEAAVEVISGATSASVTVGDAGRDQEDSGPVAAEAILSFPFPTTGSSADEPRVATLNVYGATGESFDELAKEVGFILAAHASLAARAVGERVSLERLGEQLELALLSRDVIGQAKGILMERLKTTPDEAFEILRRSSQRLNIKLREVARTLAETGDVA